MKAISELSLSLCLSMMLTAVACGGEATQTDWTGGGGLPGSVTQWQSRFASSQTVDWASPAGSLTLLSALPFQHEITTTFGEPAGVAAADLDGDHDLDIVSVAYQGNEVAWWDNDGAGSGWGKHTIATSFNGACSLHPCDIDQDGDIDVVATAEGANQVIWWENDGSGGGWAAHVVDAAISAPYSVCDADLDGDGDLDLCGAAFGAGDIVWWENTDGLGATWLRHTVDASFLGAWWADAGDIDGDGDADIAGAAYSANDICWWENDGAGGGWAEHVIDANFLRALSVRVVDMNGDSDMDLLAASFSGQIVWWENNGPAGAWTKHVVDSGLGAPFSVRAADLDGDGDQDVLSNERNLDRVIWYENVNSGGTAWLKHTVDSVSDGPNDVLAADIDGDTGMDVVATFSSDSSILWYDLTDEYVGSGSLESSILDPGGPINNWGNITWSCVAPAGTSVGLEVRAASDPATMGSWIPVVSSGDDLSGYVANYTRYFQYRVSLATADGAVSPSLDDIRIEWDQIADVGENGMARESIFSCRAKGNPLPSGALTIDFVLPWACPVALSLYDSGGRRVTTLAEGTYEAGRHSATACGLSRGVYLYLMTAGRFRSTGKAVMW